MAIIKEFREFFLRHTQVNGGAKPDQETGFITQYYVGAVLKFNRFLKGDYPSENVFKKLFESITFKKNVEDTATITEQGLSRIATDTEARDRTDNVGNTFKNVVQPHHLTDVVLDTITVPPALADTPLSTSTVNGIKLDLVQRIVSGAIFKKVFRLAVAVKNSIHIDVADGELELVGDEDVPGTDKVYGTNSAGTKGWYDSCCKADGGGIIVDPPGVIVQGFDTPLVVTTYSLPVDLGELAGDWFISLNAEVQMIADAFPLVHFNYGIAINGVPIFTKNFDNKDVSRGTFIVGINTMLTIPGGVGDNATFFMNAADVAIVKNITNSITGDFNIRKAL